MAGVRDKTYRIDGGVPAGMFMMPCESGDLTKRTKINIITRHGNSKTRPSGIETDEFPFNRIRRRKKDNRGDSFSARRDIWPSLSRPSCEDGSFLVKSWRNPIAVA